MAERQHWFRRIAEAFLGTWLRAGFVASAVFASMIWIRWSGYSREREQLATLEEEVRGLDVTREWTKPGSSSFWKSWLGTQVAKLSGINFASGSHSGVVSRISLWKPDSAEQVLELSVALDQMSAFCCEGDLSEKALILMGELPSLEFVHHDEVKRPGALIDRLIELPHVQRVAITDSQLTTEQVLKFRRATWLKWLVLTGGDIDPDTQGELRTALPDTFVYVRSGS